MISLGSSTLQIGLNITIIKPTGPVVILLQYHKTTKLISLTLIFIKINEPLYHKELNPTEPATGV